MASTILISVFLDIHLEYGLLPLQAFGPFLQVSVKSTNSIRNWNTCYILAHPDSIPQCVKKAEKLLPQVSSVIYFTYTSPNKPWLNTGPGFCEC
jgi:hypothetical protein